MVTVYNALSGRVVRMRVIADYFCQLNVTKAAKDNFKRTIREGRVLVGELKLSIRSGHVLMGSFVTRIETFLIACEETVLAVGMEVLDEYCEIQEIMDDFRLERGLILMFCTGELSDLMFS